MAVDHAMPVVELVISPSKDNHERSRSIDAFRAALRRPEVREQIEQCWSPAPPVPSGFSVAPGSSGKGSAGGMEACSAADASRAAA